MTFNVPTIGRTLEPALMANQRDVNTHKRADVVILSHFRIYLMHRRCRAIHTERVELGAEFTDIVNGLFAGGLNVTCS